MSSVTNRHFNSDDYNFAALHGKLCQQILKTSKGPTFEGNKKTNEDCKPLMPEQRNG